MSLAPPEAEGPLRRERLRTARLYFCCEARPRGEDPEAAAARRRCAAASTSCSCARSRCRGARSSSPPQTFRRLCDTYSALFIVNDDPDLARACDADGVHVGQDDLAASEARALLGPDAIIGLSTHSEEQIAAAAAAPVDYISVGPDLGDADEAGRPAVGLELISHAAANAPHPFFAIGGIDPSNAAQVVEAGARRLCVVRAIRDAADPAAAAEELRGAFAAARRGGARWLSTRASASSAAPRRPRASGWSAATPAPRSATRRPAKRSSRWPRASGRWW